jgi:large subunit ribosomal protein LP0
MAKGDNQYKLDYFEKVQSLFRTYQKLFIVNVDNVSSSQMHQIRGALRGKAVVLMGKNTLVRKSMRDIYTEIPEIETLAPFVRGNIGLVFTNDDLKAIRDVVVSNRVKASSKFGLIAQNDISIPAGNTGMDPNKTSFFQALGITTKVVKGAIEIVNDQVVVKKGEKVGASEAALLNMLNLQPFSFGMTVEMVYENGSMYEPAMLDITPEVIKGFVSTAIANVAAVSMHMNIPTIASAPHLMVTAIKNVLSVALAEESISFPLVDDIRKRLAAAPAVSAASAPVAAQAASAPAAKAAPAPAKEESDEDLGMGLFD